MQSVISEVIVKVVKGVTSEFVVVIKEVTRIFTRSVEKNMSSRVITIQRTNM